MRARKLEKNERKEKRFLFFFFVSFLDLRKLDRRFLSKKKVKLDYATRAMRRY